ncbi:hypothetical protein GCM10010233_22800 [Streptomyces pseudogriseolus]|nr:hypothetical protein GCM10010233_22800 [Streptomyces gancidicus]
MSAFCAPLSLSALHPVSISPQAAVSASSTAGPRVPCRFILCTPCVGRRRFSDCDGAAGRNVRHGVLQVRLDAGTGTSRRDR